MTVQREVNMWGLVCMGLDDGLDVKEEEEWLPEYWNGYISWDGKEQIIEYLILGLLSLRLLMRQANGHVRQLHVCGLWIFLHVFVTTLWRWGYYPYFIDWETEAKKGEMDLLRVTQLVYGFQTPWSVSSAFYHATVPLPVFPLDEDTDFYRASLFSPQQMNSQDRISSLGSIL